MVNVKSLLLFAFAASAIAAPLEPIENLNATVGTPEQLDAANDVIFYCRKSTDAAKTNNNGALIAEISKTKAMGSAKWAGAVDGKTASGYPKRFYNKGGLHFAKPCNMKGHDIYEFPILKGQKTNYPKDSKKGSANPGPIRVYYDQHFNFCGIGTKPNDDNSGNPHLCTTS